MFSPHLDNLHRQVVYLPQRVILFVVRLPARSEKVCLELSKVHLHFQIRHLDRDQSAAK